MSESVINVSELTRRFGDKTALVSVSLASPWVPFLPVLTDHMVPRS